jgi:glycosyltransferase involved in cell wall biosynthesis
MTAKLMDEVEMAQSIVAKPGYVIITPARNEAAFLEQTIQSVVAQNLRPLRWVIVSDGSTDGTDAIVERYAAKHDWIELVRTSERKERHFAGKVHAFNAGNERVKSLPYEFICSLDADITFEPDYFQFLLAKLESDSKLGLVGTPFREGNESYDYRFVSPKHVSGACQLFRRRCFEEIGGYIPSARGGIDHIAVLTARFKGWQTRTFVEKYSEHHRAQGSAKYNPAWARLRVGQLDYALGGHPVWEVFRSLYQMTRKPFIVGGIMIFVGYYGSLISLKPRLISDELVAFRRREQMERLREFILRRLPFIGRSVGGPKSSKDKC